MEHDWWCPENDDCVCDPDGPSDDTPWCGAAREIGGQQPCPMPAPCASGTCRLGRT